MAKTIAEELIEEGKELGLQRARFGSLPPAVVEQIETLGDVTRLDALLEHVVTARSLEEIGLVRS